MIIWGFTETKKKLGIGQRYICPRCNNEGNWVLLKVTSWFTLFFIPIIPYHGEHYHICPICNCGQKIDKNEVDQLLTNTEYATN